MQHNLTIRKKDNGYQVIVSYKDRFGKWRQKAKQGFATQRDAKLFSDAMIDELKKLNQLTHDPLLRDITLQELWELFIRDKERTVKPNTITTYKVSFKRLSPLANIPISDISSLLLETHINKLQGKATSINMVISTARLLFSYAVKHRIILDNPAKHLMRRTVEKQKLHILSQKDMDMLLCHLKDKNKLMYFFFSIARYTGMRYGEILGLTWADVDLSNRIIHVTKQWVRTGEHTYGLAAPKSKHSKRRIPIPPTLVSALRQLKKEEPRHISDRLFPLFYPSNMKVNSLIKSYIPNASIHDFRHTYATKLLSEGLDIKTVAALLGDTVETIIKTYIHYSEEMEEKAKKDIARIFA